jgi:BolA protein
MKNPDTLFESKMIPFLEKVKAKISTETDAEQVLLIDKSSLHSKHESFDSSQFYLRLIITSEKLKKMEKVNAHKVIFSILKDEMKSRIHALEIEIK